MPYMAITEVMKHKFPPSSMASLGHDQFQRSRRVQNNGKRSVHIGLFYCSICCGFSSPTSINAMVSVITSGSGIAGKSLYFKPNEAVCPQKLRRVAIRGTSHRLFGSGSFMLIKWKLKRKLVKKSTIFFKTLWFGTSETIDLNLSVNSIVTIIILYIISNNR